MKHALTIFLSGFLLVGCAVGIQDQSRNTALWQKVHPCYELTKDSFLYEARCADLNTGGFGKSTFCTGIQAFGVRKSLPQSKEEYLAQRTLWDKKLFKRLLLEKQRTIVGFIPKGEKLHVTRIVLYPWGETGHVGIIRMRIDTGKYTGEEVDLPRWAAFNAFEPSWLVEGPGFAPLPSPKYLQACHE